MSDWNNVILGVGCAGCVLDERLGVKGARGLRVANGPIMASAWRASELILRDQHDG